MNIQEKLLTENKWSRTGQKNKGITGLVIHWVANPQSTAEANRNFFEERKHGGLGFGAAHYIIGLQGEIIRCIPEDELAYHAGAKEYKPIVEKMLHGQPNNYTLGIECCHTDWSGKMTQETYSSLIGLTLELCRKYKLEPRKQLFLHYEITGKDCHKYFVDNPQEWDNFKLSIDNMMNKN